MSTSSAMKIRKEDIDTPEKRRKLTIAVVGCGRVGLPHACLFAEAGFRVVAVDVDQHVVNLIKKGRAPFAEPGIDALLKKYVKEGTITATNEVKQTAKMSDIIAFVVPASIDVKNKPDYSPVEKACREIGMGMRSGTLIIVMSTLGPGVTESQVKETLENASGLKAGTDFALAFSPIRASPGRVLRDIPNYVRVVGANDKKSLQTASAVLNTIVKAGLVEVSNIKTAEAVKLFQNVQRDVNLSLANEFALFCEKAGIDYIEAQKAANTDPYCHLLFSGIVSGHIPKDPYLLVGEAENAGVKLRLTLLAREINDETPNHAVHLIRAALRACGKTLRRAKVAVFGVSYRPNVKEHRGSRVKNLVDMLQEKGVTVRVYDPLFSQKELEELGYSSERTFTEAVEGIDCLVIAVGHDRFKRINLKKLKFLVKKTAAIVDMAHVIDPEKAEKEGLIYRGFGRGIWKK